MTPRLAAAVVTLALLIRIAAAAPISFPALDDPAFYLTVARNLAEGRGLVIDAIWSYQYPFASVTHPSNEYWMPLASFVLAPFFAVFGPEFRVAQAVGCVLGSLLPLPAMAAAAALAPDPRQKQASAVAGVLTALNPLLIYYAMVPDSSMVFALTAGSALWLAGMTGKGAGTPASGGQTALAAGLAAGLGYLARADGLFLLPVAAWYSARARRSLTAAGLLLAGFLLAAVPWWLRQTVTFGSPLPVSGVLPALAPDYATLFSWPSPGAAQLVENAGLAQLASLRGDALLHNAFNVFLPALGALTPFAVVGAVHFWKQGQVRPVLAGTGVLFLSSALLFPVAAMHGTFYHSLGATLPALIGIAVATVFRGSTWWDRRQGWQRSSAWPLTAGIVLLTASQTALQITQATPHRHQFRLTFGP